MMQDLAPGHDRRTQLLSLVHTPGEVAARTRAIYEAVLAESQHIHDGNFTALGVLDLKFLFLRYDKAFFDGLLRACCRPTARARSTSACRAG